MARLPKKSDQGPEVKQVQTLLTEKGYASRPLTGYGIYYMDCDAKARCPTKSSTRTARPATGA